MQAQNINSFSNMQKEQQAMVAAERKRRAAELLLSMTEIVADSKKKIKLAHEIISANKKTPVNDRTTVTEKIPGANNVIPDTQALEMQLNELYNNMERQKGELVRAKEELEQFAYAASHDLQEPLRIITGFLTQLNKKYNHLIDDTGKEYIRHAVSGAKRMRQIIMDLEELSSLNNTDYADEEVDVYKLIAELELLYRKEIIHCGAKIIFSGTAVITSHAAAIRRVLETLISNSLKFGRPGVPVIINISVTEVSGSWEFKVSDNGRGIAPEYFRKIFMIFQSLQCKKSTSGNGMGLTFTKKIIEKLNGKIWVESEEGKGSSFYFTLPIKQADVYEAISA